MIEVVTNFVRVTADDGTCIDWPIEQFEADPQACIAATGNGIAPPVPESITRGQAKIALHAAGLLSSIEAMIAAPDTPMAIKIAWAEEPRFYRESNAINSLGAAAGLSSEQLDNLFRQAAAIIV